MLCLGWTSQNAKELDDIQINFNEICLSVDSFGALLISWMDNGTVFSVTIVHTIMDASTCLNRRPRVNQKNMIYV